MTLVDTIIVDMAVQPGLTKLICHKATANARASAKDIHAKLKHTLVRP